MSLPLYHPAKPYDQHTDWPTFPPEGWRVIQSWGDGWAFAGPSGLRVLIDVSLKDDDRHWLHVSVSRKGWVPSWEDLKLVKNTFIGAERDAIMVLPRQSEYVNLHATCHHLWYCVTAKPLPDFAGYIEGVKSI
jgi:hypothetical protein